MTAAPTPLTALIADGLAGDSSWRWVHQAGIDDITVHSVTASTHDVVPGSVFVCVAGARHDGHDLAAAAVQLGAVAVVTMRPLAVSVPQIVVADTRRALGLLAGAHEGWPSRDLQVIGVTGTNGKTSTAQLLAHILSAAGRPASVRGTLQGALTTPEAPELHRWLATRRDAGDRAAVLEVSSHALDLERVAGISFELGVFTNLGQDHLDFHGTQERYFAAKAKLFEPKRCAGGVVNRDDVHGRLLVDAASIPMTTFGMDDVSDVEVERFEHRYLWRGHRVRVPLGGRFHVMNSLAALTTAHALGVDAAVAAETLDSAPPVRGRFEVLEVVGAPTVVIDFAHTPDGLEQVLMTARSLAGTARVVVVFGCGGDRDSPKRPIMGRVAATYADAVVLTSDNPRSEDPEKIIEAIRAGVDEVAPQRLIHQDPNRRGAIAAGLAWAAVNDVVVVAGKGHETSQTVGDHVFPFDDAAVVRALLGVRVNP